MPSTSASLPNAQGLENGAAGSDGHNKVNGDDHPGNGNTKHQKSNNNNNTNNVAPAPDTVMVLDEQDDEHQSDMDYDVADEGEWGVN
jgi:hypothetical protein